MSTGARRKYIVRALNGRDASSCVEVVASLPEWFGYPGALEDVDNAVQTQRGFVATDDGLVVAFVTTLGNFAESLEISYLAVHAQHRRSGLGRRLVREVATLCELQDVEFISLLTLGTSAGNLHYEETVAFYRALGFARIKEIHLVEWGGAPSLVMVAPVLHLTRSR